MGSRCKFIQAILHTQYHKEGSQFNVSPWLNYLLLPCFCNNDKPCQFTERSESPGEIVHQRGFKLQTHRNGVFAWRNAGALENRAIRLPGGYYSVRI